MRKPKIAFIIYSLESGGAERVLTTLANEFINDYDVHIITIHNIPSFYTIKNEVKIISCIEGYNPSKNILLGIYRNYVKLKKINKIVRENQIELLIGFMTTSNIYATIVGKIRKIPVIISERTNPVKDPISGFWKLFRSLTYPFANYVVVQTEIVRKYYSRKKIRSQKLRIIPNPIATALTQKRDFTKSNIKENIILNVGRLVVDKAQNILIKSFAKTENEHWKLMIAGEGPERANLANLILELDLNDKVFLLGNIREIHQLYNKAKIFAFSSKYEGSPNALIEAMHFGLACISTDCPSGPSDLITHGRNGYLVPVDDIDQLASYLNHLMQNINDRKKFSERAKERVVILEAEYIVEKWKNLINSCL